MQVVTEHEASGFIDHSFNALRAYAFFVADVIVEVLRLIALVFITVLFIGDGVLARLLI